MINREAPHNARMRNIWTLRLTTFTLWLLAAASATYWLIQTTARAAPSPALAQATVAGQSQTASLQPDTLAVAHGLGAVGDGAAQAPVADGAPSVDWNPSRFVLSGILAQGSEKDGLVMLSVDGKPAQILQLGATVEPSVVVQAISRQSVTLANISKADAPVLLTLQLGGKAAAAGQHDASSPAAAAPQVVPAPAMSPATQTAQAVAAEPLQAAAPAPAATAQPDNNPEAEREARRARMAERIEQRRAGNANATNATGNAGSAGTGSTNNAAAAPRRSVLADDNLYFQ